MIPNEWHYPKVNIFPFLLDNFLNKNFHEDNHFQWICLIEGNGMSSFQLNGERDGSLCQQQNEHRGTNLSRKEKKDVPVGIDIHKFYLCLFPF